MVTEIQARGVRVVLGACRFVVPTSDLPQSARGARGPATCTKTKGGPPPPDSLDQCGAMTVADGGGCFSEALWIVKMCDSSAKFFLETRSVSMIAYHVPFR